MIITVDAAQFVRLSNMLGAAGDRAVDAIRRAVNHTGDKARTRMVRALTGQTGLKRQVIVRALKVTRADYGAATYAIRSRGGDISLKYFKARETLAGVSAAPRGRRQVYAGSFLRGGRFPRRVDLNMGDHAFRRDGSARLPVRKVKSGVIIPQEMVGGQTRAAFFAVVDRDLTQRVEHELLRILR